ncbi:MAG: DMT family transporter [Bacteroidota bacterium]
MPKLQDYLLLLLLAFVWGSSFIIMKKALAIFPPEQVAALRIFIAALGVLPVLPYSIKRTKWKHLPVIGVIALLGSGIPPFLFTLAQTQISSALAGLLNTLTPLFTFLLGLLFFGVLFKLQKLLGVLLGMLGGIFLILFSTPYSASDNNLYGLFVVLACLCYATSSNTVKEYAQSISPVAISAISFLMIGPFAGIFIFSTDFLYILKTEEGAWTALALIAVLAIVGTAFANMVFFHLTQRTDALFASMVTYIIPLVAIFWGLLDGETIDWTYGVGLLAILSGVYLTSWKKSVPYSKN